MFSDMSDIYADFDNLDDNDKFVPLMGVKEYDCILLIILSTLPSSNVQMWISKYYIFVNLLETLYLLFWLYLCELNWTY